APTQHPDQRLLVHEGAAGRVDQRGAGRQPAQLRTADHRVVLTGKVRGVDAQHLAAGEQLAERVQPVHSGGRGSRVVQVGVPDQDLVAEPVQTRRDLAGDRAEPDQADRALVDAQTDVCGQVRLRRAQVCFAAVGAFERKYGGRDHELRYRLV